LIDTRNSCYTKNKEREIVNMSKQQYSSDFKIEAVKRYFKSGEPLTRVAAELGVKPTTFNGWVSKYKESPDSPFPGSGHLKPEDEKLRKLEKEIQGYH
jgi:transposase